MWTPTHVQITVYRARNLIGKGKGGTNDTYVTIKLGDEKYQTSIKERSKDPEWMEECDLPVPDSSGVVHLNAYHRNLLGMDEFLGHTDIALEQFQIYERPRSRWYALGNKPSSKKAEKYRGEIEVKVTFIVQSLSGSQLSLNKTGKVRRSNSIKTLAHTVGDKLSIKWSSKGSLPTPHSKSSERKYSLGYAEAGSPKLESDSSPDSPTVQLLNKRDLSKSHTILPTSYNNHAAFEKAQRPQQLDRHQKEAGEDQTEAGDSFQKPVAPSRRKILKGRLLAKLNPLSRSSVSLNQKEASPSSKEKKKPIVSKEQNTLQKTFFAKSMFDLSTTSFDELTEPATAAPDEDDEDNDDYETYSMHDIDEADDNDQQTNNLQSERQSVRKNSLLMAQRQQEIYYSSALESPIVDRKSDVSSDGSSVKNLGQGQEDQGKGPPPEKSHVQERGVEEKGEIEIPKIVVELEEIGSGSGAGGKVENGKEKVLPVEEDTAGNGKKEEAAFARQAREAAVDAGDEGSLMNAVVSSSVQNDGGQAGSKVTHLPENSVSSGESELLTRNKDPPLKNEDQSPKSSASPSAKPSSSAPTTSAEIQETIEETSVPEKHHSDDVTTTTEEEPDKSRGHVGECPIESEEPESSKATSEAVPESGVSKDVPGGHHPVALPSEPTPSRKSSENAAAENLAKKPPVVPKKPPRMFSIGPPSPTAAAQPDNPSPTKRRAPLIPEKPRVAKRESPIAALFALDKNNSSAATAQPKDKIKDYVNEGSPDGTEDKLLLDGSGSRSPSSPTKSPVSSPDENQNGSFSTSPSYTKRDTDIISVAEAKVAAEEEEEEDSDVEELASYKKGQKENVKRMKDANRRHTLQYGMRRTPQVAAHELHEGILEYKKAHELEHKTGALPNQVVQQFDSHSREDLIKMILDQKVLIQKKDACCRDLEDYIDNLLVKVMEATPKLLQTARERNSPPKGLRMSAAGTASMVMMMPQFAATNMNNFTSSRAAQPASGAPSLASNSAAPRTGAASPKSVTPNAQTAAYFRTDSGNVCFGQAATTANNARNQARNQQHGHTPNINNSNTRPSSAGSKPQKKPFNPFKKIQQAIKDK